MYSVGACGQELGRVQPRRRAGIVHGQSLIEVPQIVINIEASRSAHPLHRSGRYVIASAQAGDTGWSPFGR